VVHEGTKCEDCGVSPIVGFRYMCMTCDDYDLCRECDKETKHDHPLVKLRKCIQSTEPQQIEISEQKQKLLFGNLKEKFHEQLLRNNTLLSYLDPDIEAPAIPRYERRDFYVKREIKEEDK